MIFIILIGGGIKDQKLLPSKNVREWVEIDCILLIMCVVGQPHTILTKYNDICPPFSNIVIFDLSHLQSMEETSRSKPSHP